jgi:protein TonB
MNAFTLHAPTDRAVLRWTGSAIAIVAIHAGLIAAGIWWYNKAEPPGVTVPAIMIDMAPATASPDVPTQDAAPGPEMTQADAPSEPPPETPPQQQAEEIPPTPLMEKPVVEAPPEQKVEPTPPPPEPVAAKPEPPKPTPVKPKPVHAEVKKKPSERPPAPKTTAAPRAEQQARAASAATAGAAAAAALPSYRDRLAAHLQRYKQYPSEAKSAGKVGVATISFTVSRSGQVLASRLSGSSGVPALDAETVAMIRRAQPLPAFPPEMTQASMSFNVPIRFSLNR